MIKKVRLMPQKLSVLRSKMTFSLKQKREEARSIRPASFLALLGLLSLCVTWGCSAASVPDTFEAVSQTPQLYPDYANVSIPANIAPMNFQIRESGEKFVTRISSKKGAPLIFSGKEIHIPLKPWKKLLQENQGDELLIDIFSYRKGQWIKFETIRNSITADLLDPWVSYRLIVPGYEHFSELALYQRNLENFDEEPFFRATLANESTCTNCHSFQNRKTDAFMFHVRLHQGGTMIVRNNEIIKVDTKTEKNSSNCAYPSWHPTLPLIAFSVNSTQQIFHSLSLNKVEVMDDYSDLALYDVEKKTLTYIFPENDDIFETFPSWAPDGKTLYYCAANIHLQGPRKSKERQWDASRKYTQFKYNLMKVSFNPETRAFGPPEMVIDAQAMDKSIVHPRVSPDGTQLLFTLSSYGTFPIWHRESDLWVLDLQTGQSRPLDEVNSNESESYHTWSSNGKWFVFSSRRDDGSYTRLYFSHLNSDGLFSKPFLLPQKDPLENIDRMKSYNIPEMMVEPVSTGLKKLAEAAQKDSLKSTYLPPPTP